MKALTLTQPWATLMAIGAKTIETRHWSTPYRGPLAIVAAAGLNGHKDHPGERVSAAELEGRFARLCTMEPFYTWLLAAGYGRGGRAHRQLPRGAVVCTVELVDIFSTNDMALVHDDGVAQTRRGVVVEPAPGQAAGEWVQFAGCPPHEERFGNYGADRYGWRTRGLRRLAQPIEQPGMQGIKPLPAAIAARAMTTDLLPPVDLP